MRLLEIRKIFDDNTKNIIMTMSETGEIEEINSNGMEYRSLLEFIEKDLQQKATELVYCTENLIGIYTVESSSLLVTYNDKVISDGFVVGENFHYKLVNLMSLLKYFENNRNDYI